MNLMEQVYSFDNLYTAYKAARRGKRGTKEEIEFELNISKNLADLSDRLRNGTYKISGYYSFTITDPKRREIHALHFLDRVVQHSLCDNVLAPSIEKRLIHENAACRLGKGTDFARDKLKAYIRDEYKHHGTNVWFLKCDIHKFFDSIDHELLKRRLRRAFADKGLLRLLDMIIDSYHVTPGKGLPLGNQTSQWFALYYLDPLDRLFKEKLRFKKYIRYMDDIIIVHHSREVLEAALREAEKAARNLKLSFNAKTQLIPVKKGIGFLGWHYSVSSLGRLTARVSAVTALRFKRGICKLAQDYNQGLVSWDSAAQTFQSCGEYLSRGCTGRLRNLVFSMTELLGV